MIDVASIKHRGLRELAMTGRTRSISASLVPRIKNRLAVLDAMKAISELPASYRAHRLAGKLRGIWAIRINGPGRLTFEFDGQTVFGLDLKQYH